MNVLGMNRISFDCSSYFLLTAGVKRKELPEEIKLVRITYCFDT
jgi:hypothetical protein